ncbi:MAG: FAD-dependent oxidoreductase, partial [Chloroflexota bacterium]
MMTDKRYQVVVPDMDYYRKMVKCQAACPVHTDARAYVTAVARGDLEEGYRIAHDPNPLSTICGRICGAPCETACRRGDIGPDFEPVAIRPLKWVLTERYGPEASQRLPGSISPPPPPVVDPGRTLPGQGAAALSSPVRWSRENLLALAAAPARRRGKVAVIGAGPAGLAVAHDLALLGHQVTIYEAGPKTGGMARYGVPVYRIN